MKKTKKALGLKKEVITHLVTWQLARAGGGRVVDGTSVCPSAGSGCVTCDWPDPT